MARMQYQQKPTSCSMNCPAKVPDCESEPVGGIHFTLLGELSCQWQFHSSREWSVWVVLVIIDWSGWRFYLAFLFQSCHWCAGNPADCVILWVLPADQNHFYDICLVHITSPWLANLHNSWPLALHLGL